jgi:Na+-transporting methylmalonyl-CoA/oxaloacetate decarboxylase gamma subunit
MSENLTTALQMTAIGMGLVFAAIILLWGLMAVLVRLTEERPSSPQAEDTTPKAEPADLRAQAAAIAVSMALNQDQVRASSIPSTSTVSAWQSVMRGRQLKQRGPTR